MRDGRFGLALLRQLIGDLEPQVGVLGAQLGDLDQLGAARWRAAGRRSSSPPAPGGSGTAFGVFFNSSLARSMSWARRPERARTLMAACRAAAGSSTWCRIAADLAGTRRRGGRDAEDLHGDLHRLVELVLPLVLEHQARPGPTPCCLPGGGRGPAGPRPSRAGRAGASGRTRDLGLGLEPKAEEPLGRLAGSIDVACPHGDTQGQSPRGAAGSHCRAAGRRRAAPAHRQNRACCSISSARSIRRSDSGRAASTTLVSSTIASSFASSPHQRIERKASRG